MKLLSDTERRRVAEAAGFLLEGYNMTHDLEPVIETIVRGHREAGWDRAHTMLCKDTYPKCQHINPYVMVHATERAVAEVGGMSDAERQMHFAAGRAYGRIATCGNKINYTSQKTAEGAATRMTAKGGKTLEAYPCWWCEGWHIGRAMTAEERERFRFDE